MLTWPPHSQGNLAPKAVAEQQRRLEQLTDNQLDHQKAEKQRKYATKYHKVSCTICRSAGCCAADKMRYL